MKLLPLAIICLLPLGPWIQEQRAPGDPASESAVDPRVERGAADFASMLAHYTAVEGELRAAPTAHLDPARAAARAEVLDHLTAFRERADFGEDLLGLGGRLPYFVDPKGRHCGVAWLLHRTGEDELVREIAAADNHVWFVEIADDSRIRDWLDAHGLTAREAARIHGPVLVLPPPCPTYPAPPLAPYQGPGDRVGPNPPSGGGAAPVPAAPSGSAPGRSGPATGGGSPPPPGPAGGGPTTGSVPATEVADSADWWNWWEMHKLDYLRPDREERVISDYDLERYGRPGEAERLAHARRLAEIAVLDVDDPRVEIRAAAALVVGRLAPDRARELLEPLLSDASAHARHAALLGLGLSGRSENVPLLRTVLAGRDGGGKAFEVSPYAPYYAGVALGLARTKLPADDLDRVVLHVTPEIEGGRGHDPHTLGVLAYQRLARSPLLVGFVRDVLTDEDADPLLRCQAAETLRGVSDPAVLGELQDAASSGSLDVRRSALMALGEADHELAAEALKTAYELEAERATRGYALLALARCGDEQSGDFLREQLAKGSVSLRPFAALAVGVHARRFDDDTGRNALRAALVRRPSAGTRGALVLASGIARDVSAWDTAGPKLLNSASQVQRYQSALALGLICDPTGHAVLREAFAKERSALARAGIALGLGLNGDPPDAALLAGAIADANTPDMRDQLTVALALHDTPEALGEAVDLLAEGDLDPACRAALLGAAGIVVDDREGLALGEIVRGSNPDVQPQWLRELWAHAF